MAHAWIWKVRKLQNARVGGGRKELCKTPSMPEYFSPARRCPLPGSKDLPLHSGEGRKRLRRISSQIGRVGVRVFGLSSSRHCHQNHLISNIGIRGDIHAAFVCLLFLLGGTAGISSISSHSFTPGVLMNREACGV